MIIVGLLGSLGNQMFQYAAGRRLAHINKTELKSLSCMHVIEHIGLGRYGDRFDAYGSEKAIEELKRIIIPSGDLYLSLPLDEENRIYFNAHRAFKEGYVLCLFEPFQIVERRYIYGRNFGKQRRSGFGTGCYHLRRVQ